MFIIISAIVTVKFVLPAVSDGPSEGTEQAAE
jgi:hypothetical protein